MTVLLASIAVLLAALIGGFVIAAFLTIAKYDAVEDGDWLY